MWAAGALAYEIFGGENPFYRNQRSARSFDNVSYKEDDLPNLPGTKRK